MFLVAGVQSSTRNPYMESKSGPGRDPIQDFSSWAGITLARGEGGESVDRAIPGGILVSATENRRVAMTTNAAILERPSRRISLRSVPTGVEHVFSVIVHPSMRAYPAFTMMENAPRFPARVAHPLEIAIGVPRP